jgi:putative ABC transport system permease protein
MLKNYLNVAIRNLVRHKGYSAISIVGLAVGLAAFIGISLYVGYELSFDSYHAGADRIYRVSEEIKTSTATKNYAIIPWPVGAKLRREYPEVEAVARLYTMGGPGVVKHRGSLYSEDNLMYAEKEILDVLSLPLLSGDRITCLGQPGRLVISERMAEKYFGRVDPLGQTMIVNDINFLVSGVVANAPSNTHVQYDLIASLETIENERWMSSWHGTECYTYVKLLPNADLQRFENKLSTITDEHVGEVLTQYGMSYRFSLTPLTRIHLHSHLLGEMSRPGNPDNTLLLGIIGILFLLVAASNYAGFVVARLITRWRDISMRRVLGAGRRQLVAELIGEAVIHFAGAVLLAVAVLEFAEPRLAGVDIRNMTLTLSGWSNLLAWILGGILLAVLLACAYPGLVIVRSVSTRLSPCTIQRGSGNFRRVAVVAQFTAAVALMACSSLVYQQLSHMQHGSLGFESTDKLVLQAKGDVSLADHMESIKAEFVKHPSVTGVTMSSSVPGRWMESYSVWIAGGAEENEQGMLHLYCDRDFLHELDLELIAGHNFKKAVTENPQGEGEFILNEAAARAMGWTDPSQAVGQEMVTGYWSHQGRIVGVVRNFHFEGLQVPVKPVVLQQLSSKFRYITLSLEPGNLETTMRYLENSWQEILPNAPFEPLFLDSDFEQQYGVEQTLSRVINLFSSLAAFIACLGLAGLASWSATRRTKEIGIRKVLGATSSGVVWLLTRESIVLVITANLIAWPVVYYLMNDWLDNFAHRIDVGVGTFILVGLAALAVSLVSVCYQAIKAARANPVDALRYE